MAKNKNRRTRRLDWLLSTSNNLYLLVALLAVALWQCGYL